MITPVILIVDDEKQIHSSLRLRLGAHYQLVCVSDPREALSIIRHQSFDLCISDVRMAGMDGLRFIESARKLDPALGYVVLSGYDSEENLRRAIPLQIFDFIGKPLPDRAGFEARLPDWISRTRQRRQELTRANETESIVQDLELARIERDVESTASESAREALLQTANLLSTTQALLLSATHGLEPLHRTDARLTAVFRSLQEARRTASTAGTIAEGYFASAYADRESSPAIIDVCLRHAIDISVRLTKAEERRQSVDFSPAGRELAVTGLTGIGFLLMIIPALTQALELAPPHSTVQLSCTELVLLGNIPSDARWQRLMWVNRRNSILSNPGVVVSIRTSASAPERTAAEKWLRGDSDGPGALRTPSRGLLQGIQKSKGLLGVAIHPTAEKFELVLGLPV